MKLLSSTMLIVSLFASILTSSELAVQEMEMVRFPLIMLLDYP